MRLISFHEGGALKPGLLREDGVIDLSRHQGCASVKAILGRNRLDDLCDLAAKASVDRSLDDTVLGLPMPDADRIFCVGVNYQDRNAEYKDGSEAPKYPSLFMRGTASLVAHGQPLLRPRESDQFDYEGEIVLVIGRSGRRIARADAHNHIAGLTIMNEGSVRDWLRHGKFNVTQGKNFDGSGSLGPWIETDLSKLDLTDLHVETRINGEVRQKDTTASMAFPFADIIAYISTFTELKAGDVIATGTPTGAGARFDPPRWLKAGDVVEVEVEGVGTLRNGVEDEA